jgi:flagellar motor switch protein FliN/FliY
VADTIEYEQFEQSPGSNGSGSNGSGSNGSGHAEADLSRLSDIPMELGVEIGRTHMTVGETLSLRVGSVIELERDAGAPADLLVNGTPVARGEVVVIDERYGLRVTEILDGQGADGPQADEAAAASDAEDAGEQDAAVVGDEG